MRAQCTRDGAAGLTLPVCRADHATARFSERLRGPRRLARQNPADYPHNEVSPRQRNCYLACDEGKETPGGIVQKTESTAAIAGTTGKAKAIVIAVNHAGSD